MIEAKKSEEGQNLTVVEGQTSRYANSTFKWVKNSYKIRFAYEATDKITRFTDYNDIKHHSLLFGARSSYAAAVCSPSCFLHLRR